LELQALEESAVEKSSEIEYIQLLCSVLEVYDEYFGHLAGIVG
jgi:hypothetical protein